MSSLDYSKWDKLEDSDDEKEAQEGGNGNGGNGGGVRTGASVPEGLPPGAVQVDPNNLPPEMANDPLLMKELQARGMGGEGQGLVKVKRTPKGSEGNRHAFQHNGQTVYEWDQTLDEVNIWIKPPSGVLAQHLDIEITCTKLRIGIKENPPFLNESLGGEVIVKESFWSMQDGELTINLQKMRKAETWPTALRGHGQLDPLAKQEDQKRLMLERFGEENPGFDFSGAEFNGQIPDARNFMGGVKYT